MTHINKLKQDLDNHLQDLKVWKEFYNQVEAMDNDEIIEKANRNYMMAWDDGKVIFTFDYVTLSPIEQVVAEKAMMVPNFKYKVFNHYLEQGVPACMIYLISQIDYEHRQMNAVSFLIRELEGQLN